MMRKNCTVLATNSITAYGLRSGHCQWNESIKNFVRELFPFTRVKLWSTDSSNIIMTNHAHIEIANSGAMFLIKKRA